MTQQAGFGFTLKIKQLILKNNVENADEFKFFKCKTKLLEKKANPLQIKLIEFLKCNI